MKYRCLIVDDEPLARDLLKEYLAEEMDVEIIAACSNPNEAFRLILQEKPDFVLLDIQMPEMTGFELLSELDDPPAIVFCTAYDEYAIKAFEENAVDYLLKPFDQQRFKKAIAKVREQLSTGKNTAQTRLADLVNVGLQRVDRLLVRKGDHLEIVQVEEIIWIEAMEDYVQLHTDKNKHLLLKRMGDLIRRLPDEFVRVHRSSIVNLNAISKIHPWSSGRFLLTLRNGEEIETSKSGAKTLRDLTG